MGIVQGFDHLVQAPREREGGRAEDGAADNCEVALKWIGHLRAPLAPLEPAF